VVSFPTVSSVLVCGSVVSLPLMWLLVVVTALANSSPIIWGKGKFSLKHKREREEGEEKKEEEKEGKEREKFAMMPLSSLETPINYRDRNSFLKRNNMPGRRSEAMTTSALGPKLYDSTQEEL
jgi:hypothetical protein